MSTLEVYSGERTMHSARSPGETEAFQDKAQKPSLGEATFIIVAPGQLLADSIEYLVKHRMGAANAIRVETHSKLCRVVSRIGTEYSPLGDLLFIVDAAAFDPSGNALVAALCASKINASVLYFGAIVNCVIPKLDRISVVPDLSYTSSRIKWERHLLSFFKVNIDAKCSTETRTVAGSRRIKLALSPRQSEVLSLVLRGMTNKQIALKTGLAESTVKAHVGKLMAHFNVYRRTQLMALSMEGSRSA